ncbi:hypothetical protein LXM94_11310 [Rhizobium sp. TRM95111]|uniref:hypothetical protein n=1 Tax=Rhizobium alarense TaxID=2846851 RepID=UPI001F2FF45C|nr:hypothetical protein [Rhizobium alarense]MCF3640551.1 hypothetical protein [Rhizobium alarense]
MTALGRPDAEAVRASLARVLASETFCRSERLRSFLAYVVEKEQTGLGHQLKGYTIGIDVFARTAAFDAGSDPLVRVQAGKLRKLLDQYYETEGRSDPVRIYVPRGSYVPEYHMSRHADAAPKHRAAGGPALDKHHAGRASWLPAPVSSPLALATLLPLLFLVPDAYPDAATIGIANAKLVIASTRGVAAERDALPRLTIQRCWPGTVECLALASAIGRAALYYDTISLRPERDSSISGARDYSIRVESRRDNLAVYARLVHDESGETVHAEYFRREELSDEPDVVYEAVAFAARTLAANGRIYRHAAQAGTASERMKCLVRQAARKGKPQRPADAEDRCSEGAELAGALVPFGMNGRNQLR